MITAADLSPAGKPGSALINAIWTAYREDRRDLHAAILRLIDYEDPVVREEAISLLYVRWSDKKSRVRLVTVLRDDDDFGVRTRAAFALACISDHATRAEDVSILSRLLRDRAEDPETRRAAYEGLLLIAGRHDFPEKTSHFDPERDVDWGWVAQLE